MTPSEVLVRGIEGENHVRTELLQAGLARRAGAVRVHHAADRGKVAGLELGNCGADLGDPADDLMAGDDGVDGRHEAAKLVTDMVEIGVADTAEQDVDLNVVCGWIAPRDRGGGKRRGRTCRRVSFGCYTYKLSSYYFHLGTKSALVLLVGEDLRVA